METPNLIQELTKEMEESFKSRGLFEQLRKLVGKAIEMTDEEVKRGLAVMKSPLVVVTGSVANVFNMRDDMGKIPERIPAARLQEKIWFVPTAAYKGKVNMSMWRRIVELEALNREIADVDLSKVMAVLSKKTSELVVIEEPPLPEEPEPEPEPEPELIEEETQALNREIADVDLSKVKKTSELVVIEEPPLPVEGYTAKTAPKELWKKVVALRNSGMAFYRIEQELGLRQSRGNTAQRIYNKAKK